MVGLVSTLAGLTLRPVASEAQAFVAANPRSSLPLGRLPASCSRAPTGPACERAVVEHLDAARGRLGLGPYELPRNFTSLSPDRQLFVLTNLDRLAYGLMPVAGLNAGLDASATRAVGRLSDPQPPAGLSPGGTVRAFTSNWASNFPNAPAAYYAWMYDDGYGSPNAACVTPGGDGCWGHRQDVLWRFPGGSLAMGAAATRDPHGARGFAMLIADTHGSRAPAFYYTWHRAPAFASATKR
jgi:hypothetical protein